MSRKMSSKNQNSQQQIVPTISSSANSYPIRTGEINVGFVDDTATSTGPPQTIGARTATRPVKNSNARAESDAAFVRSQRKRRIYLIAIIALILAGLLLVAVIIAVVITFVVNKPGKKPNEEIIVYDNCSYGYAGAYCDECGVTFEPVNVKIVGGVAAARNSWPAQAIVTFTYRADLLLGSAQTPYKLDKTFLCGGTLINRRTILTAAHCMQKSIDIEFDDILYTVNVTPNKYFPTYESMVRVYLGVNSLQAGTIGAGLNVSLVKTHEDYDENTNLNDIAVLRLANEVTLGTSIQIACLPDPEKPGYPTTYSQDVWAMGFGALSSDGTSATSLNNVKMTLYDGASQCKQVAPRVTKNWNSQLCAGEIKGGKDTCQGDSGGSIFVKDTVNSTTKYVAVGIVSYGVGCALPNLPGIYTRVSYFLNWIYKYA